MNKNKIPKIVILLLKISRVLAEIALIFIAGKCDTESLIMALRLVVILEFVIDICKVFEE